MGRKNRRHKNIQNNQSREQYVITPKISELFEKYYKLQKIIPENEFENFIDVLRQPLPTTFRITPFKSHFSDVLTFVKENYLTNLLNVSTNQIDAATNLSNHVEVFTESIDDLKAAAEDANTNSSNHDKSKIRSAFELTIQETATNLFNNDESLSRLKYDPLTQDATINSSNNEEALNGSNKENLTQNDTIKCLDWYPNELAWQLNLDRKNIRQNVSFKALHQFLINETESGNISRQEAVSMLPPMVLNVQPDSKVLDMCAAPGSKTIQMIEYLHANSLTSGKKLPGGFILANDNDNHRCYLMVHQINRLASPNFAVINMDASNLPNLFLDYSTLKFDKILCDVPCSGDGTLRKNVDAWAKWNPASANGLHNLQKRILRRGVDMLASGGEIVYSTCSFNPIENEAVVANILTENNGSLELIDLTEKLKGLKWRPGMTTWKVMTKKKKVPTATLR